MSASDSEITLSASEKELNLSASERQLTLSALEKTITASECGEELSERSFRSSFGTEQNLLKRLVFC